MNPAPPGPLFVSPSAEPVVHWLNALPVLLAVPAIAILAWGLLHGRLGPGTALAGLVLLPAVAYGMGVLLLLEDSKRKEFCASCHVMTPIVESLAFNDGSSLAAMHYSRGLVPAKEACYICHSGYGIWGALDAKQAGFMHMVRTVTGRYELPIKLYGPFDIDSCLSCHAGAASFRAVEAHQPLDVQQALISRELSCTGICHPAAHPAEALTGKAPPS